MNGNDVRNHTKSLPTPSPDALFRSQARFWSSLGSHLGPRMASLGRLSADFRDFFAIFGHPLGDMWFFFARGCPGRVPGLCLGVLGTLPGGILRRFSVILCVALCPDSDPSFVQILSKFQISASSFSRFSPQLAQPFSWSGGGLAQRCKLLCSNEIPLSQHF